MNDLLKAVAPLLGTAIAGPFGAMAASFLADKLGVQEKTIAAVSEVLSSATMTPEQVTNIKAAEIDFKKWMADNEIKREQLSVDNTKDARAMQVSTKSFIPGALAIIITVGYFGILLGMMLGTLKVSDNQPLLILVGALSTGFCTVLNFFLGSSHGSQNKDVMLANSTPTGK